MEEIYFGKKVYDTKVICEVLGVNFDDTKHRSTRLKEKLLPLGFTKETYKLSGKRQSSTGHQIPQKRK